MYFCMFMYLIYTNHNNWNADACEVNCWHELQGYCGKILLPDILSVFGELKLLKNCGLWEKKCKLNMHGDCNKKYVENI